MEWITTDLLVNLALAILAILAGVVVALILRPKGKLKLVLVRKIGLINELTGHMDSLKIEYNGAPISYKLTHIEGGIVNVGNIDIARNKVYSPLLISTARGKFVDISKVEDGALGSPKWSVALHDKRINVDFDLLKKGEFLPFVALLEVPHADLSDVRLDGRIEQVRIDGGFFEPGMKSLWAASWLIPIAAVFLVTFVLLVLDPPNPGSLRPYLFVDNETGDWHRVSIEPNRDGTIDLREERAWTGPDGALVRRFRDPSHLFKSDQFTIKVDYETEPPRDVPTAVVFLISAAAAAFLLLVAMREWKELRVIRRVRRGAFPAGWSGRGNPPQPT